ncbi:MAG TPA: Tol-Pal system beta propeller repeat protein TolB [Candidatus Marinimicrobia bacterium]|nr:Tol-Pal system beta propeller repeat protein TolB [Candidatus Neomarinimicrobiota bacterium]HRS50816.1 Tol-Pal system beta propeller repeat protein TolB [Candidatus Neomarinimicrobiota bacterium]HRU91843.1 Tol-Pal system beta propeller repeat protein TolB [Candidatus Neomarinimicrobiota bacterium]
MQKYLVSFFLIPLFYAIANGQVDVFLKIQSGESRKINVAMPEFTTNQNPELAGHLRQIIMDDLNYSGYLKVIDPLADSATAMNLDIPEVIITGDVAHKSNYFSFEFRLTESVTGRKLLTKSFRSYPFALRVLAHTVSDEIVYQLCGEYGNACTKIAYVTEQKGSKELALMDWDGQRSTLLTHNRSINLLPCWSGDGKSLLFTTYAFGGGPILARYIFKDQQIERFIEHAGTFTSPEYSPDGKKVAFVLTYEGNADIYTADRNGQNLQRLTSNPAIDTAPSWSPSSREIAFTSDRSGSPQIYIMDAEGGNVRRLTYENNYNSSPKWSPKGDQIVFVSLQSSGFQICLIDVTGENLICLTDNDGSYENPAWSPNGSHLVCASNRSGRWEIYSMLRDGSLLRQLTFSGGNTGPTWSPRLKPFN